MNSRVFLLASRTKKGDYWPEEREESLDDLLTGLEYGDVHEGEYQVWEYPSGKIFSLSPDRKVASKDYYSPSRPDVWLPDLKEIEEDKTKVTEGYTSLIKPDGK